MKKFISITLLTVLVMSFTACSSENSTPTENEDQALSLETESSTENEDQALSLETESSTENVYDDDEIVEITFPADYTDPSLSQEDYDQVALDSGFESIEILDDSSTLYTMTGLAYNTLLAETHENFSTALSSMVPSEDYPTFMNMKFSQDFSTFDITTTSFELDYSEAFSVYMIFSMVNYYNLIAQTPDNDCVVTFTHATGEFVDQISMFELYGN